MPRKLNWREIEQKTGFAVIALFAAAGVIFLGTLLWDIASNGWQAINWIFITEQPRQGMTAGGILPAIAGTFFITLITILFCVPLGVSAAIYLSEYAVEGRLTEWIRTAIRNLAGVPSIVYGLFGVALFVQALGFGRSILSAGLTLGILTLPWIITTAEEALKTIPKSFREGSLALGATKWESIRTNVLPYATPGILTGTILGVSRAAGETAPILFTGAAFFIPELPSSLFDQFMALPYHLYILSTQHHNIELVRPLAYGTALVLLLLVFLLNLGAIIIRYRIRKNQNY